MSGHESERIGAYVLGVLDPDEHTGVAAHLDACATCRSEADDLRAVEAALGEIPPEIFLDGPPPDGDLLLQRTLREVRTESRRRERQNRGLWMFAAAALVIVALGAGALVGRFGPSPGPAGSTAGAQPGVSLPAGTRIGTGSDAQTGAAMSVTLVPAAGWVRLHATVGGVPAGEQCRLFVLAPDGTRAAAGSWLVSEAGATGGTTMDGSALMAPIDVSAVQAETYAGRILVTVAI